ncbi:TnsA endonuclease N-terminal domain-containing protein [Moritella viscosa]|uniref:TnsA endonuclease N-terminal domain-containing protein n=1 Tax=Moritella viscosa TaxID=80854 RepID=UPI000915A6F7|nr:TnsA endonuclease N-terminal domain-containing protein [Moritella viscosa]SHN99815.1 Putative uncharacterized protein [Moritella viscosa]SHO00933.1 Putative uncharacterized protein [Moritella viscosa]
MKRQIPRNSTEKNISRFVSLKTNSIQTTESLLEFDTCFHFEFSREILSFQAQPLTYHYQLDNKKRRYTPDFQCNFDNGDTIFFEVKPKIRTLSDEFKEKFQAQREAALEMGADLELITDEDIRIYPLLDNLKIIHRYACFDELDGLQRSILSLFQDYAEYRISSLLRHTKVHSTIFLPALYDLIAKQLLTINLHKSFNEDMIVTVA